MNFFIDTVMATEILDFRANLADTARTESNQIGSVSEIIDTVRLCQRHAWGAFVSHRNGETLDSFIADMTVRPENRPYENGSFLFSRRTGGKIYSNGYALRANEAPAPAVRAVRCLPVPASKGTAAWSILYLP